MYNRKSKLSAILAIITALLLIGLMALLPFLQYEAGEGDNIATGLALIITIAFGYPIIYAGAIIFSLVALIFGIKMLKQQSRKKLISLNVRMLITSCVLLPVLVVGLLFGSNFIFKSTLKMLPIIYTVVLASAYIIGLITQFVTIIVLKKSPKESDPTAEE